MLPICVLRYVVIQCKAMAAARPNPESGPAAEHRPAAEHGVNPIPDADMDTLRQLLNQVPEETLAQALSEHRYRQLPPLMLGEQPWDGYLRPLADPSILTALVVLSTPHNTEGD